MIAINSKEESTFIEEIKDHASTLHRLSGLGISLLKNNHVFEVYGDKSVQSFMTRLGDTVLLNKTFEQATASQQVSILSLGNLADLLYLPLNDNYSWLIGPYRTQNSKCPMSDNYYQSLKDEDRQQLILLCSSYPLKGDMEIDAFLRIALSLVKQPLLGVPLKIKLVDNPYSVDFPPSEINHRMIKPIYASIQEQSTLGNS